MSPDTTPIDGESIGDAPPRVEPDDSTEFPAEWARRINERERLGHEQKGAPREPAGPRQQGVDRHLGRHRPSAEPAAWPTD